MTPPSIADPATQTNVLLAATAEDTQALAVALGRAMRAGDVVALVGPLGSGKTTFAQGLAVGLGVAPDRLVASPTFALVNEHPGRVPFVHADLYRIKDAAELTELGLDEAFDRAASALEWADRFPDALPADRLTRASRRAAAWRPGIGSGIMSNPPRESAAHSVPQPCSSRNTPNDFSTTPGSPTWRRLPTSTRGASAIR